MSDSSQDRSALVCTSCENYLSIFPVYAYEKDSDFVFVCGRCPAESKASWHRQIAYENAVQDIIFPCRYKECKLRLSPERLKEHEDYCNHKLHKCPFMPKESCKWEGKHSDLYAHYEKEHSGFEFKIKNDTKIKIDLIDLPQNFLIYNNENLILVSFIYNDGTKQFSSCMRFITLYVDEEIISYHLVLFTESGPNFASVTSKVTSWSEISWTTTEGVTSFPAEFKCHIIFSARESSVEETSVAVQIPTVRNEMFKGLECPVCFQYLRPPIKQCTTGHSICDKCKINVSLCPLCSQTIANIRNFALEEFSRFVSHSCTYSEYGCTRIFTLEDVANHEPKCEFRSISCPSSSCSWKNSITQLVKHAKTHEKLFTSGSLLKCSQQSSVYYHCIKMYDNNLFYVTFRCDGTFYICSVQLIGPNTDANNYVYEFSISGNKFKDILVVRKGCVLLKQFAELQHIKIHMDSFQEVETGTFDSYVHISKRKNCLPII